MCRLCAIGPSGAQEKTGTVAFMESSILSGYHSPVHDCESVFWMTDWICALSLLKSTAIYRSPRNAFCKREDREDMSCFSVNLEPRNQESIQPSRRQSAYALYLLRPYRMVSGRYHYYLGVLRKGLVRWRLELNWHWSFFRTWHSAPYIRLFT
jgi:hypothetical protein